MARDMMDQVLVDQLRAEVARLRYHLELAADRFELLVPGRLLMVNDETQRRFAKQAREAAQRGGS